MTTQLQTVHIAVADLERAGRVYTTIVGTAAERDSSTVRVPAGSASILLSAPGAVAGSVGVAAVDLVVDSLADRAEALAAIGQPYRAGLGRIVVELHGIEVRLVEGLAPVGTEREGTAAIDHLALRVADLGEAQRAWEATTGARAEEMGLHPVSGGAFSASRLHLGTRMIELVSPTPGVDSPMAERLASHGEGPAALAVPSSTIDETRRALEELDVRVFRNDPHWMVHPSDAGGVLVQLTPRVEH